MRPDPATDAPVDQDTVKMLLKGVLMPCESGDEAAGDMLGTGLRLQERLGEGGFGVVWRAEQSVPVQREVAVKLIKLGMDSREVLGRFEQERQVLAAMEHPCITQVYDAGLTDDGRPYIVMELVRGLPLTHHAMREKLPREARLRLFIDLCHGVQHAHQKGVIHRDLKPSNVLAAEVNGQVVPKIIDFGIAKALTTKKLSSLTLVTRTGTAMGSPLYMAPEQVAGVEVVDTRCDIYALGAMLYELLTDTPPFPAETLTAKGEEEMRRIIREVVPQRPSRRFLAEKLPADLDWITLRALEKEPARRYSSAVELAEDVQRFLASEPVRARPPEWTYLTRLWVKRNQATFAAVLVSAFALILGTAAALWQASKARHERNTALHMEALARQSETEALRMTALAQASEKRVQVEKGRAQQTVAFLNALLDGAVEAVEQGSNPEALSNALSRSNGHLMKLGGDLELKAQLLERIAHLQISIGEWDSAIASQTAYENVIAAMHGAESKEAHRARLGTLKLVAGHGARATVPAPLEALRLRVEKAGLTGDKVWYDLLREQVRVWIKLDDRDRAMAASESMMASVLKCKARGQTLMNARLAHASALEFAGRYDEALALLELCKLTGIEEKASDSAMLAIENRQLLTLEARGDNAGGAAVLRLRLARIRAALPAAELEDMILTLLQLADFESAAGQHEEALHHAKEALSLVRSPEAKDSSAAGALCRCLNRLAECATAAGRHEEAVSHAQESRTHALRTGMKNDLVPALEQLAWSQRHAGQLEEAFGTWQELTRAHADSLNFKSPFSALEEMAAIRHEQKQQAAAVNIVQDIWRRCVSHPLGAKDIGEQGYIAEMGLKYWAAQETAAPSTPPPTELVAWQQAAKTYREQGKGKGRAAPDKGPSTVERVRKSTE